MNKMKIFIQSEQYNNFYIQQLKEYEADDSPFVIIKNG